MRTAVAELRIRRLQPAARGGARHRARRSLRVNASIGILVCASMRRVEKLIRMRSACTSRCRLQTRRWRRCRRAGRPCWKQGPNCPIGRPLARCSREDRAWPARRRVHVQTRAGMTMARHASTGEATRSRGRSSSTRLGAATRRAASSPRRWRRRPVLGRLLDEIEKCPPRLFNVAAGDGRRAARPIGQGRTVDFKNHSVLIKDLQRLLGVQASSPRPTR